MNTYEFSDVIEKYTPMTSESKQYIKEIIKYWWCNRYFPFRRSAPFDFKEDHLVSKNTNHLAIFKFLLIGMLEIMQSLFYRLDK